MVGSAVASVSSWGVMQTLPHFRHHLVGRNSFNEVFVEFPGLPGDLLPPSCLDLIRIFGLQTRDQPVCHLGPFVTGQSQELLSQFFCLNVYGLKRPDNAYFSSPTKLRRNGGKVAGQRDGLCE